MKAKHKAGCLAAFIVTAAVAGATIVLHQPPAERMLTAYAKIAIPTAQYGGSNYAWLSNTELIFRRYTMISQFTRPGIFRHDIVTGVQTEERAITTLGSNLYPTGVSPRGDWVIGDVIEDRGRNRPSVRFYSLSRIDGMDVTKHVVTDGFMGTHWVADDRHWIELYGKHIVPLRYRSVWTNLNSAPVYVQKMLVFDGKDPQTVRIVNIPVSAILSDPENHQDLLAISEDRFVSWKRKRLGSKANVILQEFSATEAAPIHQYTILPPSRCGAIQLVFSPHADRILWKLFERREADLAHQWLHRFFSAVDGRSVDRTSLWVSRNDGTNLHEIGGINNPGPISGQPYNMSGGFDRETGEYLSGPPIPRQIRWAPDGKRIAFVYNGAVWTVSAD